MEGGVGTEFLLQTPSLRSLLWLEPWLLGRGKPPDSSGGYFSLYPLKADFALFKPVP